MRFWGTLAQTTFRTAGTLLLRLVILTCTLLVLTRLLGPAEFGAFAGVSAVAVLAGALATLGTHLVVMRDTSIDAGIGAASMRHAAAATALGGVSLLAVYLAVVLLALPAAAIPLSAVLAIGIAEVVLQPFLQLTSAYLLGTGRVARSQLLMTLPLVLRFTAALTVSWIEPSNALFTYCIAYFFASVVSLLLAWFLMREVLPTLKQWELPRRAQWKDAGGYAVLNLTAAGPSELDKAISLRLMSSDSAGVYAAASRVAGALVLPVTALMLSALPRLFAKQDARDRLLVPAVFLASAGYGLTAGIAMYLAAGSLAALLGPGYESLEKMLVLLSVAAPAMSMRIAATSTLMAHGRPWTRVLVECLGLLLMGATAVVLSRTMPVSALPIALAVSEWAMALAAWLLIAQEARANRLQKTA